MNKEKVIIGLSGGVDSSVAAYLLKKQGYEVVGVTMKPWFKEGVCPQAKEQSREIIRDAEKVAKYLGISHHVVDFGEKFEDVVVNHFTEEYLNGRTPNPCVVCNPNVKWGAMMQFADEIGAYYLATGHYAQIKQLENGRYSICNSVTAKKDQTYALYGLSQEQLARTLMPVGAYEKEEIRKIAEEAGIPVAHKKDSQEICFIPDKDYASFICQYKHTELPQGNFINSKGEILGRHKGIIHYTVGQRKGLNLSMGRPVFVTEIRPQTNEVVIGDHEEVFAAALRCEHLKNMAVEEFQTGMEVLAKIRYSHKGAECVIEKIGEDQLICRFKEPQRAITPGQAVVFYQGDYIAGGATIMGVEKNQ